MHIFAWSPGADLAGVQYGMTQAVNRVLGPEGYTMRSLVSGRNYINYPMTEPWDWEVAEHEWKTADVVHVSQKFFPWAKFGAPGGGAVLHHHGTRYREDAEAIIAHQDLLGCIPVVSTVDLLQYDERATWVPAPIDVQKLAQIGAQGRSELRAGARRRIRIGHAPTDRRLKGTQNFVRAMQKLRRYFPVDMVLIEKKTWSQCLEIKSKLDIYYDQMHLGYGSNAAEAWAMGIPVIAGSADPYTLDKMRSLWGGLPFVPAQPDTLYETLVRLMDEGERQRATIAGVSHVRTYHSYEAVAGVLRGVYRRAAGLETP